MAEEAENYDYAEERPYSRDRSRSPANGNGDYKETRNRSASPDRRDRDRDLREQSDVNMRDRPSQPGSEHEDEEGSQNPGSNLFITGLRSTLDDEAVKRLFEKYGDVEECKIMVDPHSKESRGFGFVKMANVDQADAARAGLSGTEIEGKTIFVEKAKRNKGRKSTPGKYCGRKKERRPFGGRRRYEDSDRYGGGGGGGFDRYRSSYRSDNRDDRGGRDDYRDDRYRRRDDYRPSRREDYDSFGGRGGHGSGPDREDRGRNNDYAPPRDERPRDDYYYNNNNQGYAATSGSGRGGFEDRERY